jgi:hypothetical protein
MKQNTSSPKAPGADQPTEKKAKEKLAKPPKDNREVTIGPTVGTTGRDVSLT